MLELTDREREWLAAARAQDAAAAPAVVEIPQAWYYGIDITLGPAVVVMGADDQELVERVAQAYATQVQRPVLVVSGPAPAEAQVMPVSGVTGNHEERSVFAERLAATERGILVGKHA